ncbi:MAG: methyltransferase domain-containing protein [Lachnospiraceae bacterium]
MTELEKHYNKFCEDKRLLRRHGQVEYITSMKYIHEFLGDSKDKKIIDIGAGTGRYSVKLADEGYDVTAVELVKYNLGILKSKKSNVKAFLGNALDLSKFGSDSFDMALVFGPMYHLFEFREKVKVLNEAKRVTKKNGYILVAYCMNEYSIITYAFKKNFARQCIKEGKIDKDFHCICNVEDLYDYARLEDIDRLNKEAGLKRVKIIAADGPADYIRPVLKDMDEETFQIFINYHLSTCERAELLGASAHTLDILQKM